MAWGHGEREKSQAHKLLSLGTGWTVDSMASALLPSPGPRRIDPEKAGRGEATATAQEQEQNPFKERPSFISPWEREVLKQSPLNMLFGTSCFPE